MHLCFIAAMNCSVQIHTECLLRSEGESTGLGFQGVMAGACWGAEWVQACGSRWERLKGKARAERWSRSWPFFSLCTFHYEQILPLSFAPSPLTFPSFTPNLNNLLRSCSKLEGGVFLLCSLNPWSLLWLAAQVLSRNGRKGEVILHFQC